LIQSSFIFFLSSVCRLCGLLNTVASQDKNNNYFYFKIFFHKDQVIKTQFLIKLCFFLLSIDFFR
jgi:hypothetical protein